MIAGSGGTVVGVGVGVAGAVCVGLGVVVGAAVSVAASAVCVGTAVGKVGITGGVALAVSPWGKDSARLQAVPIINTSKMITSGKKRALCFSEAIANSAT